MKLTWKIELTMLFILMLSQVVLIMLVEKPPIQIGLRRVVMFIRRKNS